MGAAFPLTGFSEMPKATGSVPQQFAQRSGQQTLQQPSQQIPQSQPSIPRLNNISPEQMAMIRNMHARLSATGGNVGPPVPGNPGDLQGQAFQPGAVNPVVQQHQQMQMGINLEMMQALMQRKQEGGG